MRRIPVLLFFTALSSSAEARFTLEQVLSAPFASSPLAAPGGSKAVWSTLR